MIEAELSRSLTVVEGVTGKMIFDLSHLTSTLLSPAFTAETGASTACVVGPLTAVFGGPSPALGSYAGGDRASLGRERVRQRMRCFKVGRSVSCGVGPTGDLFRLSEARCLRSSCNA